MLISVLLPALTRAREQANAVRCLATLRNMYQAALLHANEHQGFMPAAGEFTQHALGIDSTPQGLRDPQMKRYLYYYDSGLPHLMPLSAALATYLGVRPRYHGALDTLVFLGQDNVRQLFKCPSQDPTTILPAYTVIDAGDGMRGYMSYVFNAAFLGRTWHSYGLAPTGQLSRVRRPGDVFLFADGKAVGALDGLNYGVFDEYTAEETLADEWGWRSAGLDFWPTSGGTTSDNWRRAHKRGATCIGSRVRT